VLFILSMPPLLCFQVRSLLGQIRPDRQTLLFSATLPRKIERLISDALSNPVRITVGQMGVANEDIRQAVEVSGASAGVWRSTGLWRNVQHRGVEDCAAHKCLTGALWG
jgi:ATP-dependent RNA helicase DDX42